MTDKPNGNQSHQMPTPPAPPPGWKQMLKAAAADPPAQTTQTMVDTVLAQAEAHIARVVQLGEYARDHGDYIASKCSDYARMMRTNADNFASELLASEARRRDEIAKLIGKGK